MLAMLELMESWLNYIEIATKTIFQTEPQLLQPQQQVVVYILSETWIQIVTSLKLKPQRVTNHQRVKTVQPLDHSSQVLVQNWE